VVRTRDHQQIEILVRLDQAVYDLHRRRRIDIGIHLPDNQQQLTLQSMSVVNI